MEKASVLVLIAEDHYEILTLLQDALEEGGFAVHAASNAKQAFDAMDTRGAEIRALVTDIQLSGALSGWDLARRGRELNPKLPVVYTTGSEGADWPSQGYLTAS